MKLDHHPMHARATYAACSKGHRYHLGEGVKPPSTCTVMECDAKVKRITQEQYLEGMPEDQLAQLQGQDETAAAAAELAAAEAMRAEGEVPDVDVSEEAPLEVDGAPARRS